MAPRHVCPDRQPGPRAARSARRRPTVVSRRCPDPTGTTPRYP
jgi:hypothetical protein